LTKPRLEFALHAGICDDGYVTNFDGSQCTCGINSESVDIKL